MSNTSDISNNGIVIESILGSSLAVILNFQKGDLVHSINGVKVHNRQEIFDAFDRRTPIQVTVIRGGNLVLVSCFV